MPGTISIAERALFEHISKQVLELGDLGGIWDMYSMEFDNKIAEVSRMKAELTKKCEEVSEIARSMEKWLEAEKDKMLQKILHEQLVIHERLKQKYQEHIERLERNQPAKQSEEEFTQVFQTMLRGVLYTSNQEEFARIRREFVLRFINTVEMYYDKKNNNVVVTIIVYADPSIA